MHLKHQSHQNDLIKGRKQSNGFQLKIVTLVLLAFFFLNAQNTFAHCDSYDGPVIKDAKQALATNNVNLVMKWVGVADEAAISTLFNKTYTLKNGDKEIYDIVEQHFLETLVRLHRATEGVGYTGLKPAGSASPIVVMADASIDNHTVDNLLTDFTAHIQKAVREKYTKVEKLSRTKNASLAQGRAYVEAYVDYTHTLEGMHGYLEHGAAAHQH